MQGARLSQAQKAFDDMNEDSVEKKVTRDDIFIGGLFMIHAKVGEIVRYLLCADKKKLPVKKKG